MNTKNNRRKKDSQEKIEKAFIDLIQTKQIEELWKNIDALSIDYTQIYNEIYKEVQ